MTMSKKKIGHVIDCPWMVYDLHLDPTRRAVFEIVYSFSRHKEGCYASHSSIAERACISVRTAVDTLNKLSDPASGAPFELSTGLIVKTTKMTENGPRCTYHAAPELVKKYGFYDVEAAMQNSHTPMQDLHTPMQNSHTPYADSAQPIPYNTAKAVLKDNKKDSREYSSGPATAGPTASAEAPALAPSIESPSPVEERSSSPALEPTLFQEDEVEELRPEVVTPVDLSSAKNLEPAAGGKKKKSAGQKRKSAAEPEVDFFDRITITFDDVPEDLAAAFVDLRPKSAKNTERAWKDVVFGVSKARALGFTSQQFFHFMVYHGWYGCNAGYVFERLQKAQPEELQDMSVEEAVAQFQKSQPAARPAGGYNRPAPAAKPSKVEQNTQSMLEAIEILNNRV